MSSQTLLTITEAAEMVGLTRPTFYRKIDELGISITEDNGKKRVDVSELIRVFGSDVKLNKEQASKASKKVSADKTSNDQDADEDVKVRLAVLEAQLKNEKLLNEEIKDQVEYLKDQVALEKEEKRKMTLLLEDHTDRQNRGEVWEKNFRALETRIANQEKTAKAQQEERQRILKQNQSLKKALDAEKNKTLWQRLFG